MAGVMTLEASPEPPNRPSRAAAARRPRARFPSFHEALSGGDPRSLGRANEIAQIVLKSPRRTQELLECIFSDDEAVRMRGSDALEKVCRERPALVVPFTERLLADVSRIDQPSVQWHLAQMLSELPLDGKGRRRAIAILRRNLGRYDDWIVVNLTIEALAVFARQSPRMWPSFSKLLLTYVRSPHRSVARRASKLLAERDASHQVRRPR